MTIKALRIGSMENIQQYDDAEFDCAIETTEPIRSGPPVDPNDVLRLVDLGTILGDVKGPATSTDHAIARFDGTDGKKIQDSLVIIYSQSSTAARGITSDQYSNDTYSSLFTLRKSRNATPGSHTILQNNDAVANITGQGSDGVKFVDVARVRIAVDGTPGVDDMPGRIEFWTTPDGAAATVERMRIDNNGKVGIGKIPTSPLDVVGYINSDIGYNVTGANAQYCLVEQDSVLLSGLSGASVSTGIIPPGSLILGVTAIVTVAITGATSFKIGDGTDDDKWGSGLAITLGTRSGVANFTTANPTYYGSGAGVVLTAVGGNFTGGSVRLVISYIQLYAPTS